MIDLSQKTVTIVGRLTRASTAAVEAALKARGSVLRRGQPRQAGVLVVGAEAYRKLDSGGLRRKLKIADDLGTPCLSEARFLGELGLLRPRAKAAGVVAIDDLPAKTGLEADTIRLLVLFDVIRADDGQCSFRDLVAVREVARLSREGSTFRQIVEGARRAALTVGDAAIGPVETDQPLARLKLVSDAYGGIVHKIGGGFADLDGQMRLPLPDADNPTIDELFEAAEEAEWLGEYAVAIRLYQRCIRLDRNDPIAPFNLAAMLQEQGEINGAIFHLRMSLALDPHFPHAWYNLALLMDGRGEKAAAREGFERAIEADGDYADPIYNLAQLYFDDGDYNEAARLWARYLTLDPDSEWSRRARHGLALCHRGGGVATS